MVTTRLHPGAEQALALAAQYLQAGDAAGAELALAPAFAAASASDPQVTDMTGLIRLHQGRFAESAVLFQRARAGDPRQPLYAVHHARAQAALGQADGAAASLRAALKMSPDFALAYFELASLQRESGRPDEAENTWRKLLRAQPENRQARLALGLLLLDSGRPAEAEAVLRRALLNAGGDPGLDAPLANAMAWALRRQNKNEEALAQFETAQRLDPAIPLVDVQRAEILQELKRTDESLALFRKCLERDPADARLHHHYNDLLYRLNATDEYLKSYDRAPQSRDLMLGKAHFLSHEKRGAESHAVYAALLARDANDREAAIGAANALVMMQRHAEAGAIFDSLLARDPGDAEVYSCAAEPALLDGDPEKAMDLCRRGLEIAPHDGTLLAGLSVAYRMLEDERDELLNGYDTLVQSFELEPPEGFSSMESFNTELNAWLDRFHPQTREFLGQSLRGGTQTPGQLFGAGHALVEKLQARIDEAVGRYIAGLKEDAGHPFLSRRAGQFRYAGSWSSRLRDCGFHTNHIHPEGWISSCYYVGVPDAVQDTQARQGWIKFGESSFEVPLKNPVRRAIQPAPGKLVLFPSYMWHGTIPFRDAAARTTIAFDVIPD